MRRPDATIVLRAGDFLAPSLLSSLDHGVGMMDCLQAAGITHVCLGNHETDVGAIPHLARRIHESVWENGVFVSDQSSKQIKFHVLSERIRQLKQKKQQKSDCSKMRQGRRPVTWLNTNMPALDETLGLPDHTTVSHDVITISKSLEDGSVVHQHVGLLGLLTNDRSLYRPDSFGDPSIIDSILPSTEHALDTFHVGNIFQKDSAAGDDSMEIDLWIPLTHQSIADDREFAQYFLDQREEVVFPVICGGHDHEPYQETSTNRSENTSIIVKAGIDAHQVAIVDLSWSVAFKGPTRTSSSKVAVHVELLLTKGFPVDSRMKERVESHWQVLKQLETAKLFNVDSWCGTGTCTSRVELALRGRKLTPQDDNAPSSTSEGDDSDGSTGPDPMPFSTANNRLSVSTGTTALTTMVRMGMRCQCAILNAGAVRANRLYPDRVAFTYGDLKAEIPFSTEIIALYIPGHVLQSTIRHSRRGALLDPPAASGGFLHTCSNIIVDPDTWDIHSIMDEPFESHRMYLTALPHQFFLGIDNHQPLLDWVKEDCIDVPDSENATPAKLLIVQVFSSMLWLKFGSFEALDQDMDGRLSRAEIRSRVAEIYGSDDVVDLVVDNVLSVADHDNDGFVTPLDMIIVQFAATDLVRHVSTSEEMHVLREITESVLQQRNQAAGASPALDADILDIVKQAYALLDEEGDGKVNREEFMGRLGKLKSEELLS
jgi:5'-nucleotidase